MLSDVTLVVFGVVAVLWGKWLLPRQLKDVRTKMSQDRQQHFDDFFQRAGVRRLFAAPAVCGGLLIVTGVAFLLTD